MEDSEVLGDGYYVNFFREGRIEEEEEEFRSCCEDDEEAWKEPEELVKGENFEDLNEFSANLFFKGVSVSAPGDSGSGFSGIGVMIQRSTDLPTIRIQKRLNFYLEELVADYLALMDGLAEAVQSNIHCVYAFTDSKLLYKQIIQEEEVEIPLLNALRERILEHTHNLETFVLRLVAAIDIQKPLQLAQVAIGFVSFHSNRDNSLENCSICCEDKPSVMTVVLKCSHKFCSHCMKSYVDSKVQSSQVPVKCPQLKCKYFISTPECQSFLPFASYESFERAVAEVNVHHSDWIYCSYPNCSVLLDPRECLSSRASSSSQSDNNSCVECPVCQRFICVECGVPWHSSLSCEEYQNLPLEERDSTDITLHRLAQNKKWKRCQQCRRMIELTQGCNHMTCLCGHEFCYSCGTEYREGQQTCQCLFWDDNNSEDLVVQSVQESEQWAWETFNSLPMVMDAYSDQERSQLALIQRLLAGGFSLGDHNPYQSPPRCTDSYVDPMKDLHQLPWLERFVSVISDNYYEDYI